MRKNLMIGTVVGVAILAVGGAGYVYTSNQNEKELSSLAAEKLAMEKKDSDDKTAMEINPSEVSADKTEDAMVKTDEAMKKDEAPSEDTVMVKASSYTTLADFDKDPSIYKDDKKVYFFHAPWCSICQGIHNDISSDTSQIPTGTTFIKTDFDSSTSLRQKYGVTTQYTFVQVDNNGNELKQWSATNLDNAIAGIQ